MIKKIVRFNNEKIFYRLKFKILALIGGTNFRYDPDSVIYVLNRFLKLIINI